MTALPKPTISNASFTNMSYRDPVNPSNSTSVPAKTNTFSMIAELDGLETVLDYGERVDDRIQNALLDEICCDIGIKDSIDLDFLDFDDNQQLTQLNRIPTTTYETSSKVDPLRTAVYIYDNISLYDKVANAHGLLNETSPLNNETTTPYTIDQSKGPESVESFHAASPASFASSSQGSSLSMTSSRGQMNSASSQDTQSTTLTHFDWSTPTRLQQRVSSSAYIGNESVSDIQSTFSPRKRNSQVSSSLDDTLTASTPTVKREPTEESRLERSPSTPSLPTTTVDELIASSTPGGQPTRRNADQLTPPDQGINRKRVRVIESGGDLLADVRECYAYTRGADMYATTGTAAPSPIKSERSVTTPSSSTNQQRPDSTVECAPPTAENTPYWQQQQPQAATTLNVPNAYQYNGIPQPAYRGYANIPSHYQQQQQQQQQLQHQQSTSTYKPDAPQYTQLRTPSQHQLYQQQQQHQITPQQYQTYARTRQLSYPATVPPIQNYRQPTTTPSAAAAVPMRTAYHQAPQSIAPSLQPLGFESVLGATSMPNLSEHQLNPVAAYSVPMSGSNPILHQSQTKSSQPMLNNGGYAVTPTSTRYPLGYQPPHMQQGYMRRMISDENSPFRSHPLFSLLRDLIIADMNYHQPSFPLQLIANLPTDFSKLLQNYFNRNPEASAHMMALRSARENGDNSSHSANVVMEEALQFAHKAIIEKIKARRQDLGIKETEPAKPLSAIEAFCERFDRAVQNSASPGPADIQGRPSTVLPTPTGQPHYKTNTPTSTAVLGATPLTHLPGSRITGSRQYSGGSPVTSRPHDPSHLPSDHESGYGSMKQSTPKASKKSNGTAADSTGTGKNKVLPKESVAIMLSWLRLHQDNPYPNDDEKESLIISTHLTMNQINYWFTNARRRILPKWAMQSQMDQQTRDKQQQQQQQHQMAAMNHHYTHGGGTGGGAYSTSGYTRIVR